MMISIDNIRQVAGLLNEIDGVSELSLTCPDGSHISVKKQPPVPTTAMVPYSVHPGAALEAVSNAPMDVELVDDEPEALISAKLVGVFRAAKPALAPQSQIALGQIVGYIESMKLMNEVRADMSGTVNDVLIQDGQPVEYGQPLVRVDLVA